MHQPRGPSARDTYLCPQNLRHTPDATPYIMRECLERWRVGFRACHPSAIALQTFAPVEISLGSSPLLAVLSSCTSPSEIAEEQPSSRRGDVSVPGGRLPDNGAIRFLDFAPSAEGLQQMMLLTAQSTL